MNITVVDPATSQVVDKVGFDTTANSYESDALAEYLAELPAGQIALVVTYGEAWSHLTPEAIAALQNLGVGVTLEEMQGNYLAAVGVQGAAPGSATWTRQDESAFVRVSLNPDRRDLAAAVDWITVGP